jgi:hypothetical protein
MLSNSLFTYHIILRYVISLKLLKKRRKLQTNVTSYLSLILHPMPYSISLCLNVTVLHSNVFIKAVYNVNQQLAPTLS